MIDKQYQKISIACSDNIIEALSNFLVERSGDGILIDDESDKMTILTAYIDSEVNKPFDEREIENYFESIKEFFDNPKFKIIELDYIPSEDWLAEWKKTFHPIHVTDRIVACPSWEKYDQKPGEIVIIIDPKMAFGTGHHETTAQCMLGLEMLRPIDQRVLDYGCGTGLLAIAAAKMGAAEVIAVDNDPEATSCARENFVLNDVEIELIEAADYIADPPVDIITANLNIGLIIEVFEELSASLKSGGHIIYSGIPIDDRQRLLDFISDKPYDIIDELADTEWVSYIAVKR
ncbi:MAG: 50S ribosomal protein L11 methyltransferase [candidate division Zixibacteria bacterium]|nr:50S ribosomal protein L11 methyltransferase [candidate division Zixibacteria bacterium]